MPVGKFIKAHGYRTKPVYKCVNCGKMTRETGDGESQADMCKQCYFEAGQENQHTDCHTGRMEDCPECQEAFQAEGYELRGDKWCDHETENKDDKNTVKELTDQIYDTIAGNVGMSEYHTSFPTELLEFQEVESKIGQIYFRIGNKTYSVKVEQVEQRENDCPDE